MNSRPRLAPESSPPRGRLGLAPCAVLAALAACSGVAGPTDAGPDAADAGARLDAGACAAADEVEDVARCAPLETDYQPREGRPGAHGWGACISDDGTYHLIGAGLPAAAARTAAFAAMAPRLWANPSAPTRADFLAAREAYSVSEGIASRVARRQDVTYPEVPGEDKFACASAGVPEQYPDRCAGPARLKPLIDDAFQRGLAGEAPRVQAARLEAALLWFFHLSATSEVWTCSFDDLTDCDSAIGYYTAVSARAEPLGLASYVQPIAPETHDRIYDALLAVRCWRDLDPALPTTQPALYRRAAAQLLRASLRGQARILRQRIGRLSCAAGEGREAEAAFVQVLGRFLDHAARARDAAEATRLFAFTSTPTASAAEVGAAQASLDALFDCP